MMLNILITGKPGIGKTTVLNRVKKAVENQNYSVGGVTCPEMRKKGRRVGFNIIDVSTDKKGILAHVKCKGPHVGKYGVNLEELDGIAVPAIENAIKSSDYIFIDEIAPMELHSKLFCIAVKTAMDSKKPVIAVIHKKSSHSLVFQIKSRDDVVIFEVTAENRDLLEEEILKSLKI